jgi:hypothetical protein
MWRRRMTQHSLVTIRLTMIFQHCGETRKHKLSCSISLKGAKSSWSCYKSRGLVVLRIDALRNQGRRRQRDHNFQSSRGLDCLKVVI